MIVTVVGSGTLVPHPSRSTPALYVQDGDRALSFDGGSGTLRRQAELGLDYETLDWLCFSHIHPDHTLDLLHFLFAATCGDRGPRQRPVNLVGPKGFSRFVDHFREGVRSWTSGGVGGIQVTEVEDGSSVPLDGLTLEAVEMHHSVTDMGYRLKSAEGRLMAFTGDTGPGPQVTTLARDADVLICECSAVEANPMDGHMTAAEAGRAAAEAGVRQLVLTHLYPVEDDRQRLREAARYFSGPILLSRDGDRFSV